MEQVSQLQIGYCIEGHLYMYMYYVIFVQLPVVHILMHTHVHALMFIDYVHVHDPTLMCMC